MEHSQYQYQYSHTYYSLSVSSHIYCFSGLPGVGKSTVSEQFIDHLQTEHDIPRHRIIRFRTDEIRKDIYDDPQYTTEETRHVYFELCHRVRRAIFDRMIVICDATFSNQQYREMLANMAYMFATSVTFFNVTCPEPVAKERIRERGDGVSDADTDVYDVICSDFDQFCGGCPEYDVCKISTEQPLNETVADLNDHIVDHQLQLDTKSSG